MVVILDNDNDHYYALVWLLEVLNLCTKEFGSDFLYENIWNKDARE